MGCILRAEKLGQRCTTRKTVINFAAAKFSLEKTDSEIARRRRSEELADVFQRGPDLPPYTTPEK